MDWKELRNKIRDKMREIGYYISEKLKYTKYGQELIEIFKYIYEQYNKYLYLAKLRKYLTPEVVLFLAIVFGIVGFVVGFPIGMFIHALAPDIIPQSVALILSVLLSIALIDIIIGGPYFIAISVREQMERYLPEALKQFSSTIKAGGTYTYAIKDIADAGYGRLSEEFDKIQKDLREGSTIQKALERFADRTTSKLIKRTMGIIIDAIEAGGGLSKVMDSISEDIKSTIRIKRERKAKTSMHAMLLAVSGILLAPAIFGMVLGILYFLITVSTQVAETGIGQALEHGGGMATQFMKPITEKDIQNAKIFKDMMYMLFLIYASIESLLVCIGISVIQESKVSKSIIYIPLALLATFTAYHVGILLTMMLLGLGK